MDRRAKLVALLLALPASSVFAGYALPAPPPGFGGSPGGWTFTPPANAPTIGGGSPAANSPLFRGPGPSLGGAGGAAPSTAAYRLGGGAARTLAGGIARGLIPGLGLALGVAWLAENCFARKDGQWVRTCGPGLPSPIVDGYEYATVYQGNWATWQPTAQGACEVAAAYNNATLKGVGHEFRYTEPYATPNSYCRAKAWTVIDGAPTGTYSPDFAFDEIKRRVSECPIGSYSTPAGCVLSPPPATVTPEEIEAEMAPKPLPSVLPGGVPYPLDPNAPFIFNPTPGNDPQGQPMRVPNGRPVPIPDTNPQKYRQPVTRWTSAPTPTEPWRMNVEPEDVIGESPVGMESPQPVPPGSDSPRGEKPEQFDLCKEHPDIIACQVFKPDELTPTPVTNKQVPLAINKDGGFPSGGACPAPKVESLFGMSFAFSMQPICDFAIGIRPLLIGFAWLTAAMTFLGVARKEN